MAHQDHESVVLSTMPPPEAAASVSCDGQGKMPPGHLPLLSALVADADVVDRRVAGGDGADHVVGDGHGRVAQTAGDHADARAADAGADAGRVHLAAGQRCARHAGHRGQHDAVVGTVARRRRHDHVAADRRMAVKHRADATVEVAADGDVAHRGADGGGVPSGRFYERIDRVVLQAVRLYHGDSDHYICC